MSANIPENPNELIAISDPGERNKEEHLWSDRLIIHIANITAWLFPLLIIAIVSQVVLRKLGSNQAWLDDLQWWMYGFAMIIGFGYAITTNSHVRVDIFHQNYSDKTKSKIEIFALGWLLIPFLAIMADILTHYAIASWTASEGSDSPNGLHKLYLLKATLPMMFILAIIASFSALYRNLSSYTSPTLWKVFIGAFPAIWFIAERAVYYVLWWYVRFTKSDLHPRRIQKEALLEYSTWIGLAFVILVIIASFYFSKQKK